MTTASAPGKIILLGEHAAVYGKPVLTLTVDLRAFATVNKRDDNKLVINAPDLGIADFHADLDMQDLKKKELSLIVDVLKKLDSTINLPGLDVTIRSDIPIASGMGSSASIASAMIMATSAELGKKMTLQQIAELAWECEHIVHSKSSGVDPFTVTFGGLCRYQKGKIEKVDLKELPNIVIGNTGVSSDTGVQVSAVNDRKNKEPELFESILDLVEDIVEEGQVVMQKSDWEKLGLLMDINHGLLASLGVSCEELEELVQAARKAGALGAKLCGAGGGGIMIALVDDSSRDSVSDALGQSKVIDAKLSDEGVRIEK